MNPSNLTLTKLAAVCDRLAKSGRLSREASAQARELHAEWGVLIDQSMNAFTVTDPKRPLEPQADDLAAGIVDFLEGLLFSPVLAKAIQGQNDNPDLDFRPVEIPGEPLSATILRERR